MHTECSTKGPLVKINALPQRTLSAHRHVLGQNRSLEEGAEKYLVPQKFSNHVLGQNRFRGQGPFHKIAPPKCSNHVVGQSLFLWQSCWRMMGQCACFAWLRFSVRTVFWIPGGPPQGGQLVRVKLLTVEPRKFCGERAFQTRRCGQIIGGVGESTRSKPCFPENQSAAVWPL